jgi:hypothetical protein
MRTTVYLDEDVSQKMRALADSLNLSIRAVINRALRKGLPLIEKKTKKSVYRTVSHDMRLRPGLNLDNISDLLATTDGESYR